MKVQLTLACLVALSGCIVVPTGTVAPTGAAASLQQGRERFTFPSTSTRATLAYSCRPGAEGGGTAARAASAHASFDRALAGFAAQQASVTMAAINSGQTGDALDADLKRAGDDFAARQRADLDSRYGCIPAGEA